jgi:hypothetical protein
MAEQTRVVQDALNQLRPRLDAYREGHMRLDEITTWLSSYDAEFSEQDPVWAGASRRIWALLSEIESGYGTKASIHQGLDAIARDCGAMEGTNR